MATSSIPLHDLDESAAGAKFKNIGDTYAGKIVALREEQQTEYKTRAPKTFADGSPMMQIVVTLEQRDGSTVALYAKGGKYKIADGEGTSMRSAIGTAVRNAKADGLDVGGELAVRYSGNSEAEEGLFPARLFTAEYRPPTAQPTSLPVNLFSE